MLCASLRDAPECPIGKRLGFRETIHTENKLYTQQNYGTYLEREAYRCFATSNDTVSLRSIAGTEVISQIEPQNREYRCSWISSREIHLELGSFCTPTDRYFLQNVRNVHIKIVNIIEYGKPASVLNTIHCIQFKHSDTSVCLNVFINFYSIECVHMFSDNNWKERNIDLR